MKEVHLNYLNKEYNGGFIIFFKEGEKLFKPLYSNLDTNKASIKIDWNRVREYYCGNKHICFNIEHILYNDPKPNMSKNTIFRNNKFRLCKIKSCKSPSFRVDNTRVMAEVIGLYDNIFVGLVGLKVIESK